MEEQNTSNTTQPHDMSQKLVITFELVTDDNESENDPALVLTLGRDTVMAFQQKGYILRPVYTGQKGDFIVEVVTKAMQFIWNYHEEIIANLSGLVTIFGTIIPAIQEVLHAHEKRVGKEESATNPIKIKIEIDGTPIMVEASDIVQAEAALKLANRYYSVHPNAALQATTKSNVKVQGLISARKRRQRR